MKYKLETIPVWDAVEHSTKTCIICHLMEQSEARKIEFYLGNSVMNPETRVRVNSRGFCVHHYRLLTEGGKPLSLGLMAHTRLQETACQLEKALKSLKSSSSPRSARKAAKQMQEVLDGREKECLICEGMQDNLNRYLYTTVHLWGSDEEFRTALRDSGGVCFHHLPLLTQMAPEALSGDQLAAFCRELGACAEAWLQRAVEEVHWLTQRNKSQYAGSDWKGCEQAHIRAVVMEIGSGRIHEPPGRK